MTSAVQKICGLMGWQCQLGSGPVMIYGDEHLIHIFPAQEQDLEMNNFEKVSTQYVLEQVALVVSAANKQREREKVFFVAHCLLE